MIFHFFEIPIYGIGQKICCFRYDKVITVVALIPDEIPARFAKQEGDISVDKFTPMFDITLESR